MMKSWKAILIAAGATLAYTYWKDRKVHPELNGSVSSAPPEMGHRVVEGTLPNGVIMTRETEILPKQETISQAVAAQNPRFWYDSKFPAQDETVGVNQGAVPMVIDRSGKIIYVPKDMVEAYKSRGALIAFV